MTRKLRWTWRVCNGKVIKKLEWTTFSCSFKFLDYFSITNLLFFCLLFFAVINAQLKENNSKLKQSLLTMEQRVLAMEGDLQLQRSEKDELQRSTKIDRTKETFEVKNLLTKIENLEEELKLVEASKIERESKVKALNEETKTLKHTILTLEDQSIMQKQCQFFLSYIICYQSQGRSGTNWSTSQSSTEKGGRNSFGSK